MLQYDLVQIFNTVRGSEKVDLNTWFTLVVDNPSRITRDTCYPLNISSQN